MRPCAAALKSFLEGSALAAVVFDFYTFALSGGTVLRYSGSNMAMTIPNARFPSDSLLNAGADRTFALGPKFGRSKVSTKIGVEPAELDIEVIAGADDLVGNLAFADAVRLGLFDGATVELDRFFAAPPSGALPDVSLGVLVWFYGRVADAEIGRSKITLKVKSLLNLLAIQQMPRRLYQASCGHVFGDAMCGYDRVLGKAADGTSTGIGAVTVTALAGSTQAAILASFSPSPATIYDQGTATCLTGANAGASRTIFGVGAGAIAFKKAWLDAVAPGDTFQLLPGCDHTLDTCATDFLNIARYGGFPYIPPPEAAV